jgi:hypothetical protein
MRHTLALAAAACLVAAGCGDAASSGSQGSAPSAGGIAGRYLIAKHLPGQSTQHPPGHAVLIGVFRRRVWPAGPIRKDAEQPLARVRTARDGRFGPVALRPGRYFVMPLGVRELAFGRWVRVRHGALTRIVLQGCGDCPRPLGPVASGTP